MNRLLKAAAALLFAVGLPALAATSNATATITDSDGQTWNNCSWSVLLVSPRGAPTIGGVAVPPAQQATQGVCSSSGVLSATLADTSTIDQAGATYTFTLQPNASVSSTVIAGVAVVGASPSLSAALAVPGPRFQAGNRAYGYLAAEVLSPSVGSTYFNTGTATPGNCQYSLAGWTCGGGGSGGASFTPTGIQYATSTTAATVATSAQVQATIGSGVYDASGAAAAAQAATQTTASLYTTNLAASYLPHMTGCLARVRAGTGDCRWAFVGDSTTFGVYCNGGTTGDFSACSPVERLAELLTSNGIPAQADAFFGDGSSFNTTCGDDARVSCGAWTQSVPSAGGDTLTTTAGSGATLTFTPRGIVDSATIWYVTYSTNGTFTFACDSNAATTINTGVGGSVFGFTSATIACPSAGHHTFTVAGVLVGAVFIDGIEAFNSTKHAVRLLQMGWAGATTAFWNSAAYVYSPQPAVASIGADVDFIDLQINDWRAALWATTNQTQYQALVTAWKVNSDVVIETPIPSNFAWGTYTTQANQAAYIASQKSIAVSSNAAFIDQWSLWVSQGSYAKMSIAPYLFYGDTAASPPGLHGSYTGYTNFAGNIQNLLSPVLQSGTTISNPVVAPQQAVYTVATLPSAAVSGAGAIVAVSDDAGLPSSNTCTGGGTQSAIAVSNGVSWSCH